uniref:M-phase phosphoprotein 9 n=1 Tax=Tetraodon nigroviridis TaxID=99883 RepID=H3BVZ7_TETNG
LNLSMAGLTYWHLNENELYHPLPDSFDSGAYLLLQEASMDLSGLCLTQEPRLSLKEIYHNKQRTGLKHSDCEGLATVSSLSPQMLTLDPSGNQRQSDHTSGFTSPSHFSSPSFHLCPSGHTPVSPDSMGEYSPNPADTDAISDSSSVSAARPSKAQSTWGFHNKAQPCSHTPSQQHRVSAPLASEEEGSNTHTSTLIPCTGSAAAQGSAASLQMEKASSLEDPVVLSLVRQRLREKHARHVADLKAYYETEIQLLQDKLKLGDLPQDVEKANETLTKRCKHLEKALSEATRRVQELEATNSSLEKKLAEWPERYAVAGAAVKSLQQRLDESKRSEKEKDATVARLKSHARQLEEELQKARRDGDEKDSKSEREYKMLQDDLCPQLLGEYESLRREHEELKNNLVSTENKLCDANDQISELKRFIFKLESQVKQLEHENQARARFSSHSNTRASGAGLLQTNQSSFHQKQPSGAGCSADTSPVGCNRRNFSSPSEGEHSLAQPRYLEQSSQRREKSSTLTPVMRALIELEEAKATESRAPSQTQRRHTGTAGAPKGPERGGQTWRGPSRTRLRAQRSLSPESHRSSSLPPAHRNGPPATPTKRETLLMPQSAKSSPKRCPTENFSTVFGCMMPREE